VKRRVPYLLLLCLGLLLVGIGSTLFGSVRYSFAELWAIIQGRGDDMASLILLQIRLPRIILAVAVGAALSVSGAAFQGLFRNALADPFVIGASSGAAFGAALSITLGLTLPASLSRLGVSPISICAFVGALLVVFMAFVISRSVGNPPPSAALLLAGTALSSFFSSLLSLLMVLKDRNLQRVYYWLLGSLNGTTWLELRFLIPVMLIGALMIALCSRPMDLLLQGEDVAESLGVDVRRTRVLVALGASLATAAAVSAAGIIGFVGLIAPHTVRLLTGPSHRKLIPASALGGAILLVVADTVVRSTGGVELPIGVITSLGGAPFFIYLLARHGKNLGRS
jgi:iron complex transport system permease protein